MNEFRSDMSPSRPPRRPRSRVRRVATIGVAAVAALTLGVALGIPAIHTAATTSASSRTGSPSAGGHDPHGPGYGGFQGSWGYGGHPGSPGSGYPGDGTGTFSGGTAASGSPATGAESTGIVLVDTTVDYGQAAAAGTGMVLTAGGEVLTNNHVVAGSTSVSVEVVSTGKVYPARVVGTDATDDVAVLQLQGASGLATARIGASSGLHVGDSVTGVGNAEGQGALLAVGGTVTGLGKSITTQAEQLAASESLSGLIETDAAIQSGDSGGPLYDAAGRIVGIDTAASAAGAPDSYAIPISKALGIARAIASGSAGADIVQGTPAFLGVQVAGTAGTVYGTAAGAEIAGVVPGSPAARAGLAAGDVITAIDGAPVTTGTALGTAIKAHAVGSRIRVAWVDAGGVSHTATVTLAAGPAA